jgi:hypothetical protein
MSKSNCCSGGKSSGQGDLRTGGVGSSEAANKGRGDNAHNSTTTPTDKVRIGIPGLQIQQCRQENWGITGHRDFMCLRVMNGNLTFPIMSSSVLWHALISIIAGYTVDLQRF